MAAGTRATLVLESVEPKWLRASRLRCTRLPRIIQQTKRETSEIADEVGTPIFHPISTFATLLNVLLVWSTYISETISDFVDVTLEYVQLNRAIERNIYFGNNI